ncbi:MAG: FkbM family methyltransferase [Agriterribacter sp.]
MIKKLDFLRPVGIREKIRFGNKYDGGYVLYKNVLPQIDILMSYGIGWDTSFEDDFNRHTNKPVLMFDPTMYKKYIVNKQRVKYMAINCRIIPLFQYLSNCHKWYKHIKVLESRGVVFIKEGIAVKKLERFDNFSNHLKKFQIENKNIMLKIDIEGDEYEIFRDNEFQESLKNVNQIIIEFHDLKNRLLELRSILKKLQNSFEIIHIHGNNFAEQFKIFDLDKDNNTYMKIPDVIELTLVRNSLLHKEDFYNNEQKLPVKDLDYPNNPHIPDYSLDFF